MINSKPDNWEIEYYKDGNYLKNLHNKSIDKKYKKIYHSIHKKNYILRCKLNNFVFH